MAIKRWLKDYRGKNYQATSNKMRKRFGIMVLIFALSWAFMMGTRYGDLSSAPNKLSHGHIRYVTWQGFYIAWFGYIAMFTYSLSNWKWLSWSTSKTFRLFSIGAITFIMMGAIFIVAPTQIWGPMEPPGINGLNSNLSDSTKSLIYIIETTIIHFIIPFIATIEYFTWEDIEKKPRNNQFSWFKHGGITLVWPALWFIFTIIFYHFTDIIPYEFLNPEIYGWVTPINIIAGLISSQMIPWIMIYVDRKRFKKRKINTVKAVNNKDLI